MCDYCGEYFYSIHKCNFHMLRHFGKHGKFKCKICGGLNCTPDGMKRHLMTVHKMTKAEADETTKDYIAPAELLASLKEKLKGKVKGC